jgi:hypothetical protein
MSAGDNEDDYLALTKALNVGLSKAYFRSLGLPSLFEDC